MAKVQLGRSALDYLNIDAKDLDDIQALADDRGGYWQEVESFVADLADRTAAELTFKQTSWAVSIKEKLDDLRRKGRL